MDIADCPNLVTDWPVGSRTGNCEDCGNLRRYHPRQSQGMPGSVIINMQRIVRTHLCSDLLQALNEDLPFKIPTMNLQLVQQFPQFFVRGNSDIEHYLNYFLDHLLIGESDWTTVILDGAWLGIVKRCVEGVRILHNQLDQSSMVRRRPDTSVEVCGATALKGVARFDDAKLHAARAELVEKLHMEAVKVFPRGCNTIVGIASSVQSIGMYLISFDPILRNYATINRRPYDVSVLDGRVEFVVDIFKFMRWMSTIRASNDNFHLSPGIRLRTPNHHHVTWIPEGILKEYYHGVNMKQKMVYMNQVYSHQPPLLHVEYGRVVPNTQNCIITRIGNKLITALSKGLVTRDQVLAQVQLGLRELHQIGLAHCDVSVNNVYVDDMGVAFLSDLEYLTPVDQAPFIKNRLPYGVRPDAVVTALQLDEYQYQSFSTEVYTM